MVPKICSIDGCDRTVLAKMYCRAHYQRLRRHGNPLKGGTPRINQGPEKAFEVRTEWRGECLEWVGHRNAYGYGVIPTGGSTMLTHRYAWERKRGPIPLGIFVDHICHNPACCNIAHLRLVTPKQNRENLSGPTKSSPSGYLGVHRSRDKWRVRVRSYGETHNGGTFASAEDAAIAAQNLRNNLFTHNNLDRA